MGVGAGGTNHLKHQTGEVNGKPVFAIYCGSEGGYYWEREIFDRMVAGESESRPCVACIRALERDAALAELAALRASCASYDAAAAYVLSEMGEKDQMSVEARQAASEARAGEHAERSGFALDLALQFGASPCLIDDGLIVIKEDDLAGLISVLGFRTGKETEESKV
jgi:hypothetical protein